MSEKTVRTIKKYPNRRLYDTHDSKYITVSDVREMVVEGIDFRAIDTRSKKDITRTVLLQIIIDQESATDPLFSTDNLQDFIRYYGAGQQQGFSAFLNQSLAFFHSQRAQFRDTMQGMTGQNAIKAGADISRKDTELLQRMQGSLFGQSPQKDDEQENTKDSVGDKTDI
jgi:polyhydroxyalkanoate synthesis repressor PhaR